MFIPLATLPSFSNSKKLYGIFFRDQNFVDNLWERPFAQEQCTNIKFLFMEGQRLASHILTSGKPRKKVGYTYLQKFLLESPDYFQRDRNMYLCIRKLCFWCPNSNYNHKDRLNWVQIIGQVKSTQLASLTIVTFSADSVGRDFRRRSKQMRRQNCNYVY